MTYSQYFTKTVIPLSFSLLLMIQANFHRNREQPDMREQIHNRIMKGIEPFIPSQPPPACQAFDFWEVHCPPKCEQTR
jgi:hypothetical protein